MTIIKITNNNVKQTIMKIILFVLISIATVQVKAQWSLTGNASTNPDTNFIGTTDSADLIFKKGNIRAGLLSNDNTSFGVNALNVNSSGLSNTATGFKALTANTTGYQNTATGRQALTANTIGLNNTANGSHALYSNTTGSFNTANGSGVLIVNISGSNNTANGAAALYSNTTGNNNTANGVQVLNANTTGNNNTASGRLALNANTIGNNNSADGMQALYANTTGNNNTASGTYALRYNTTGNNNTACGYNTGSGITIGSANTIIGANVMGLPAELSNTIILADGNGNQRLYINNMGNVGIGTTKPQSTLAVNGTITAKQVKVTLTGWPDYVFDKDYHLMHLDSLSSFVHQHKHLPEIPTVKDIENNGIDVGINQALLLKKIEELTLYIIEQHKQIAEQKERIQKLENKLR